VICSNELTALLRRETEMTVYRIIDAEAKESRLPWHSSCWWYHVPPYRSGCAVCSLGLTTERVMG
jgi:hypothetical protein